MIGVGGVASNSYIDENIFSVATVGNIDLVMLLEFQRYEPFEEFTVAVIYYFKVEHLATAYLYNYLLGQ